MKKLFLLSLILFGCASSTVYVPQNIDLPKITSFDQETLREFNSEFVQLNKCEQFYVSEFSYVFYMMLRDSTTIWKICGQELNSEQKKIWVKYFAMVGWQFFDIHHNNFCKAKAAIELKKEDPRVLAREAAMLVSLYIGLTSDFDICTYDPRIKTAVGK